MQEYRKKMEEQKRLREKLLREKENRRKMAAIEKQNEDAKIDSNTAGRLIVINICCTNTLLHIFFLTITTICSKYFSE